MAAQKNRVEINYMEMTGKVMTLNMTANGENIGQNVKKNVDMAKDSRSYIDPAIK